MTSRPLALVLCAAALLFALSGCTGTPASPPPSAPAPSESPGEAASPPPEPSPSPDPYAGLWKMIDGSTATIPLSEAIAADRLGLSAGEAAGVITHNTTHSAYINLLQNKADLIFVTYPSEDEFELARTSGLEMEVVPVVKDAFVFLVNAQNPVRSLTLQEVRAVYTGTITNWREVGGRDEGILAYQRPENSGSQTLFLKLVMDGRTPMTPPLEWVEADMGGLVDVVSSYDNGPAAIGYSVFYYVSDMYGNDRFRLLGINGVVPDRDSIARGEYPLETCYYAVLRKNTPENHPARQLLAWLLSDEGQKVAQDAGYVPLRELD